MVQIQSLFHTLTEELNEAIRDIDEASAGASGRHDG